MRKSEKLPAKKIRRSCIWTGAQFHTLQFASMCQLSLLHCPDTV